MKILADTLRPNDFSEFIGQKHIVNDDSLICKAVNKGYFFNAIFYGPPGTGKTSLANIIINKLEGNLVKINAVSSGVAEIKKIIENSKSVINAYRQTYVLIDECHRWSKAQSDSILEASEKGDIIFIGTTTENPFIHMNKAIISRCKIFEFKHLKKDDIKEAIYKLADKLNKIYAKEIELTEELISYIADISNGDLRNAINTLENAIIVSDDKKVTKSDVENSFVAKQSVNKTEEYDYLSAFCKSLRGSDSDAAIYYAHKLVDLGMDPMTIARRLVVHSSEDVGLANSNALQVSTSAMLATEKIGYPECMIILTHAIIYVCESPKSNSVIEAVYRVKEDLSKQVTVPNHLKNHPVMHETKKKYLYPHDYGEGYVNQQYMPDEIVDKEYYIPKKNGKESVIKKKKFSK